MHFYFSPVTTSSLNSFQLKNMCSIHLPLPQLLLHSTELKEAILLLFGVHGQLDVIWYMWILPKITLHMLYDFQLTSSVIMCHINKTCHINIFDNKIVNIVEERTSLLQTTKFKGLSLMSWKIRRNTFW